MPETHPCPSKEGIRNIHNSSLCKYVFHQLPGNISQPETPALVAVREAFMIQAEQVKGSGLEIVNMYRILYDVVTKLIGFS